MVENGGELILIDVLLYVVYICDKTFLRVIYFIAGFFNFTIIYDLLV